MFIADYEEAIVLEAKNYGFRSGDTIFLNNPAAVCLHTPEEPADNHASTPEYFATTDRPASTHYFISYLGKVWQCVPEEEGAYANAVQGKPYPMWAEQGINLNLQTLSVEIEGYAADIYLTMPRGSAQWQALVALLVDRCKFWRIPPSRIFGHYEVSVYRSDPGRLDIAAIRADVEAAMKEDDMVWTQAEKDIAIEQLTTLSNWRISQIRNNDDQQVQYLTEIEALKARVAALEASMSPDIQALIGRLTALETATLKDGDKVNVHFIMTKEPLTT